ncbi:MAG: DUF2254 domain-containing protein [Burkholderiaceae bacterium]
MVIRTRLLQIVHDVRESCWFLPGLIAAAGVALGLGFVLIDASIGDQWLGRYEWFYGSRPEGARAMLSTIAGSTITVAGVVFSITLAAVTYASGQFGPRLLGNFTRDRGNQATLGVFIGTYLYCLVVLRTIRSAQEISADTGGAVREAFVPHIAMFGGLALAIVSTTVLIYFVHHVTTGIHINTVIARVGQKLIDDIRKEDGNPREAARTTASFERPEAIIASQEAGYIEAIDFEALLATACGHNLTLRPLQRAGDFVATDRPLLAVTPEGAVDDRVREECVGAFALGRQRSSRQDLRFAIDELVEIAARALSPGVNDPFTAIACIDWLGAALGELERSCAPCEWLFDEQGAARVQLNPLRFEDYLQSAFGQLRRYVAADPNALRGALATLQAVSRTAQADRNRALVEAEHARLQGEG